MCYYVGDIIKFQNFNSDNISIDEKPHENISIFDISYEKKLEQNLCVFGSAK